MGDVTPGYTLQDMGAEVAYQHKVFLVDGVAAAAAAAAVGCPETRSSFTDPLLEGILTGQTSTQAADGSRAQDRRVMQSRQLGR